MMVGEYSRSLRPPDESFFLFGPRGSGKSTWTRSAFPRATVLDFLDEELFQGCLRDPGRFGAELGGLPPGHWVVVDEVQRIPGVLNEVHRAIEQKGLRFVMTGSSAHKLRRAGTNLLAGRALEHHMFPFLPEELGDDFDLDAVLRTGALPIVWTARDRRARLKAYTQLFLKEEIQAEALVRNLAGFARFLPVAALFHGQVVNLASVARDAGVGRATVDDYFAILGDANQGFFLTGFEARLRVRERRNPKWYWLDPGVPRALKAQLGEVSIEERGSLLEGYVATLLRAHDAYAEDGLYDRMHFWAPADAAETEVDFVLVRGREVLAIEVKATDRLRPEMFKGVRAIADLGRVVRRVVVTLGKRRFKTEDGVDVVPFARFAAELSAGRLWP